MAVPAYWVSMAARVAKIGTVAGGIRVPGAGEATGVNPKKSVGERRGVSGGRGGGECLPVANMRAAASGHSPAKTITSSRTKGFFVMELPLLSRSM
jgi:hypothetical protein